VLPADEPDAAVLLEGGPGGVPVDWVAASWSAEAVPLVVSVAPDVPVDVPVDAPVALDPPEPS
jgi:hypothetical protein